MSTVHKILKSAMKYIDRIPELEFEKAMKDKELLHLLADLEAYLEKWRDNKAY